MFVVVAGNDAEDTSEGAIVVGGEKNEPSSNVSRKSLVCHCSDIKPTEDRSGPKWSTYVSTENSLPKVSGVYIYVGTGIGHVEVDCAGWP